MDLDPEIKPTVDFALLADAVQVVVGKLYVLGGGWDALFVPQFPARFPSLGLGLRIRIPWSCTDRPIRVEVDLQDEDGGRVLPSPPIVNELRVGRPPGMPEGTDLGIPRSFTFHNIIFPREGAYSFVVLIDGDTAARVRFVVRSRPRE